MDPSDDAFHELDRALNLEDFTLDTLRDSTIGPGSLSQKPPSSRGTNAVSSVSDYDGTLDSSHHTRNTIATSSPAVNGSGFDLPPTPPTPQHRKAAVSSHGSSQQSRAPAELRSQPSGLSSSGIDWHSLPTPDPSPPGVREFLPFPFYLMNRNPSTYADSFRTAKETQSCVDSPESSRFQSPGVGISPIQAMLNPGDGSNANRRESAVSVKDVDDFRAQDRDSFASVDAINDPILSSPTIARSLSQGTAQRRLRALIQPGDAIKRPDESLLYMNHPSPTSRIWQTLNATKLKTADGDGSTTVDTDQPREDPAIDSGLEQESNIQTTMDVREQQSMTAELGKTDNECQEGLRQGLQTIDDPTRQQMAVEDVPTETPRIAQSHGPDRLSQPEKSSPVQQPPLQGPALPKSTGLTKDKVVERPTTPLSAAKSSSLEDNNVVYKLIREENVKRHSNISDGSVQAVVVAPPEHKRVLRHTPKRHSLRGDVSLTSNSHRSSAESGKRSSKRHTGTTMTASDTDLTSPDISPMIAKAALKPVVASHLPPAIPVESSPLVRYHQSPRAPSSGSNTIVAANSRQPVRDHVLKRSNRIDYVDAFLDDDNDDDDDDDNDDNDDDKIDDNGHDLEGTPRRASPPMHQAAHMSSRPVYVPLTDLRVSPKLRKFSNESRLENNMRIRRTSLGKANDRTSQPLEVKLEQAAKELTREGQELPDDRHSFAWTSTMTSPKRGSFDVFLHHPTHTSFSVSQASIRSDIELLEARGVTIFPHNNESLLVVQQGIRSADKDDRLKKSSNVAVGNTVEPPSEQTTTVIKSTPELMGRDIPTNLAVVVHPRVTTVDTVRRPKHTVDSPLTNPRAPPEPPAIKFIPPTPCEELEQVLSPPSGQGTSIAVTPQRRPSITQRVRRYSESLIQPLGLNRLGSLRRQHHQPQTQHASSRQRKRASSFTDSRPTYLSSFWQPRDFWEEYGSDSSDDSDELLDAQDPVVANMVALPPGGDTSNVEPPPPSRALFPRNMSVRMPGFRGTGGFLLGNTLGIDRHGTNSRRHYVRRRTAEELHKRDKAAGVIGGGVRGFNGDGEITTTNPPPRRPGANFRLPFGKTATVEYVGFTALKSHLKGVRARREELAREKKRERLKMRIGTSWYHDTKIGGP